jgi:2',3'-cyclic-nucleotide 2'-phosphodiesterase (5'-nucleotidase family)
MLAAAGWAAWTVGLGRSAPGAPGESASSPSQGADSAVALTFLHVNDVHGQTQPRLWNGKSVGGYSRLSTAVDRIRSSALDANRVLLVHAGDELSRGDELTMKSLGAANIYLLNFLRLDAWTPGNGDFYNGTPTLQKRIAQAKFPTLAANVTLSASGQCLAEPYVLRQAGPVKVAIFGLCTVYKESQDAGGLSAADPVETASKLVPQLRKQADVVVALTHLGYLDDIKLAQHVAGIDLILGGHSHTVLEHGQKTQGPDGREVLICQTGDQLQYLGCAELTMKPAAGGWRIESSQSKLIALDASVPEDPAVKALIARLSAATQPAQPVRAPGRPAPSPAPARAGG